MWFTCRELGCVFFNADEVKFLVRRRFWFPKITRVINFGTEIEAFGNVVIHKQKDEEHSNRYLDYSDQRIMVEVYGYGQHVTVITG